MLRYVGAKPERLDWEHGSSSAAQLCRVGAARRFKRQGWEEHA